MVAGNVMLLVSIHPHEAYRWFMEMFIDSAEWVMGPNVYGMALFSDGGLFATNPIAAPPATGASRPAKKPNSGIKP